MQACSNASISRGRSTLPPLPVAPVALVSPVEPVAPVVAGHSRGAGVADGSGGAGFAGHTVAPVAPVPPVAPWRRLLQSGRWRRSDPSRLLLRGVTPGRVIKTSKDDLKNLNVAGLVGAAMCYGVSVKD
jgi:hypothetical protein